MAPMNEPEFITYLKKLKEIPAKIRADLYLCYRYNRRLASRILRYIRNHPEISAIVALSIVIAYLASTIPIVGPFTALLVLVTSGICILAMQVRADLEAVFSAT